MNIFNLRFTLSYLSSARMLIHICDLKNNLMVYSSNHIRMNGLEDKMLVNTYITYRHYSIYF